MSYYDFYSNNIKFLKKKLMEQDENDIENNDKKIENNDKKIEIKFDSSDLNFYDETYFLSDAIDKTIPKGKPPEIKTQEADENFDKEEEVDDLFDKFIEDEFDDEEEKPVDEKNKKKKKKKKQILTEEENKMVKQYLSGGKNIHEIINDINETEVEEYTKSVKQLTGGNLMNKQNKKSKLFPNNLF